MKHYLFTVLSLVLSLSLFAQLQYVPWVQGYWEDTEQNTNLPPNRGIQTISVVDSNVIWADAYDATSGVGTNDFIFTLDGGLNWNANTLPNVPSGWEFSHFAGFSDAMAWACCYNPSVSGSHLYRTLDGGLSWEEKNPFGTSSFINVIHFFDAQQGLVIGDPLGGYYEIYTTTDGGDTWTRVPQANIPAPLTNEYGIVRSICTLGDNVWFGTSQSRIYRSTDKGLTWAVSDLSSLVTPTAVAGFVTNFAMESASTGMCFIQGADTVNHIVKTTDGGATWTQVLSNTQKAGFIKWRNDIGYVKGVNPSTYVVTGARYNIGDHGSVYTQDMGATWVTIDSAVQHLETVWASPRKGWSGGFTNGSGGMFEWHLPLTNEGDAVENNQIQTRLKGYPNPTQDIYTISLDQFVKSTYMSLRLTDITGKEVYKYEVPTFNGKFKHTIEMKNLNTGIYFLNLQVGDQMITKKVTKN